MAVRDGTSWPLARKDALSGDKGETSLLEGFESKETRVVGTTNLYQNGQLRLIPV